MLVIAKALNLQIYDHCMLWAACTLAYFGFLRAAEFTVPSLSQFSKSIHLEMSDLAVDSTSHPSCLRIHVKASKTDPFRKGSTIYIGRGAPPLCAVEAVLAYLSRRGNASGPLFLFQSGEPLSRPVLNRWLSNIMEVAGVQGKFSSHSFRIGAATVAARNGVPDHLIQTLGRWSSDAFKLYIRTPSDVLANLSQQLA